MRAGFIGLGTMGAPMARNLARYLATPAGKDSAPLVVWNRTPDAVAALQAGGAPVIGASSPADVFAQADVVFLMLANSAAIDEVLGRHTPAFTAMLRGRIVVAMGTTAPAYSAGLEADIVAAGGSYVEAPVSGSRVPAEQGALVGMVAGEPGVVALVAPLLPAFCERSFDCGAVPGALRMKLAVNLFLITMVSGLAEATHLARQLGLDLSVFRAIVDAGPMASKVSTIKLGKLVEQDYAAQASAADVLMNATLIADAAREAGVASPLLDISRDLFARTTALGHGKADMAAVILAF